MAFSQKLYDHWKTALVVYFADSIAYSVLRVFDPTYTNFAVRLIVEFAFALVWFPGALYILGEFVRLSGGHDPRSKRLTKMLVIGFVAFFGAGVAIPNMYNIAFDAFQTALPTPPTLSYLLNGGDLAGKLTMGLAAVFSRGVGPTGFPEPEKAKSIRAWLLEELEPIGFSMLLLGFVIGFGVTAFAAFILIIAGAILLPIGFIIRRSRISES